MTTSTPGRTPARNAIRTDRTPTALLITAALEAYGSDLQLFQSAVGLRRDGFRVVVVASRRGRLADRLSEEGVELRYLDFPVVTRSQASPRGLAGLLLSGAAAMPRMMKLIKEQHADLVYVNTVTMPWWLAAGRLCRVRTVCHVHEAEIRDRRLFRVAMTAPLSIADLVIVNSRSTETAVVEVVPRLGRRTRLIYNGIEPPRRRPDPYRAPAGLGRSVPARLVVVGRISPRKAPDVAVEATAMLRRQGRDVRLELCGTVAEGKEAYARQLEHRARQAELDGAVTFLGYVAPVWSVLEGADVVVAPSLGESFGNAVVEAQLAGRPVVATAVQGHLETVTDEVNGLLVPCQDPSALATAIARLLDDPGLAERLARRGRQTAMERFSSRRYRSEINSTLRSLIMNG
jgi:glycosyltransferase involved in cell wall biosynthesis